MAEPHDGRPITATRVGLIDRPPPLPETWKPYIWRRGNDAPERSTPCPQSSESTNNEP